MDVCKEYPHVVGAVYMKAAGAKVVGMDTGVPEWIGQIDTYAQDPTLVKDMCRQMDEMVAKVRTWHADARTLDRVKFSFGESFFSLYEKNSV